MPDITSKLLPLLKNYTLPGLNIQDGFIHPKYEDQSIMNIPTTICKWMNLPGFSSNPLVDDIVSPIETGVKRVILILVDGLEYHRFQKWLEISPVWKSMIKSGILAPISSISPSTTSSALSTLWTGLSPAAHGIIGYEMWIKEYGIVGNMITLAPMTFNNSPDSLEKAGFSPESFMGNPPISSHLKNNGVKSYAFTQKSIARSGLSRMLMKDVEIIPFHTPASMWVSIRQLLEQKPNEMMYVWSYWGQIDGISHIHGPDDERVSAEFSMFSSAFDRYFLQKLAPEIKRGTMVILTSDHGQTYTPLNSSQVITDNLALQHHLRIRPTCENRLAFLHIRPGSEQAIREYFSHTWPGSFTLINQTEALESRLFGPGPDHPGLRDRIGDLIAIAHGNSYLWWSDYKDTMLGRHGGMTFQDMVVPFLAIRL